MIKISKIDTPLGEMVAGATKNGICLLEFADRENLSAEYEELATLLETTIKKGSSWHIWTLKKQLKEYFRGKRKDFTLKLVTPGTEFQQSAWKELLKIPYGETISYHEQAEAIKNTGATRAVAHANASNRIAIIIPCHRVIGADGALVGYGGGLERKRWLLIHERKNSGKPGELNLF
ncbi:MAG: methylated-DNA--[protein]-cysteine S-methyltransferase [Bacteroidales bacterium]|jgi:AraC family transcriptional regulator of adaptative response/methylated-DNA-[protein]-cysteine methyltransferase|nr:methylated-DNA--[protein]-cysteine S-methyltransferase [Bacteroidales bacterium]